MDTKLQNISSLLALCKLEDTKAQSEIYNLFYKAMYNTALKMTHDKNLIEDILQEAFLNAFLNLDQCKNEALFGSWLKKIVVNKTIDLLKSKNKNTLEDINTVLYTLVDDNNKDDSPELENLNSVHLLNIIYSLKGKNKIIMILFYVKGYSKKEICEIMNITLPNFHTILFRAKKEVKRKILL